MGSSEDSPLNQQEKYRKTADFSKIITTTADNDKELGVPHKRGYINANQKS